MSLNVDTYVYEANGKWTLLEDPDDDYSKTMAGFERSRSKLWGSEAVRALGARFFPRLDGSNLQVEPGEIDDFLAECEVIHPHLDHRGEVSGYGTGVRHQLLEQHRCRFRAGQSRGRRCHRLVSLIFTLGRPGSTSRMNGEADFARP